MQYVIKENETLFDVALSLYGDAIYAAKLVADNEQLGSVTNVNIANISVYYDETIKPTVKASLIVSNSVLSDVKPSYIVPEQVSVYDLAVMYGYGIENVVSFMNDNNDLSSLDETDISKKNIVVTKKNETISNYLFLQNKVLASNVLILNDLGDYLLQEDDYFILQEDGYKILL